MAKAFPWGFEDMDRDTRHAARAAAKRSGKSLGDWLDDVIHEKAEAELVDPEDIEDDYRPEQAARRFSRVRGVGRLTRDRGHWRREGPIDAGSEAIDAPFRREDLADRTARDTRPFRRAAAGPDPRSIVDDAVAQFERRAAMSERKTARALAGLADLIENRQTPRARPGDDLGAVMERLDRIESRVARQPEAASARPIRSALARLESRIDRLSNDDRVAEVETALQSLDRRLATIAERLEQDAEERHAPAPRHTRVESEQERRRGGATRRPLADAIAEITERQRALQEQSGADERAPHAVAGSSRLGDIRNSIATISDQLREASEHGERESSARQIEQLRRELEGVSRALVDLAPRASIAAVETALRELSQRVEAQRDFGVRENVLAPVERLTADLHKVIGELDPSRIVHDLYDEVKTIGDKLAARPVDGAADQAVIEELAAQTREIRDLLKGIAARPLPLEKLEAGLAALTTRVDELSLAGHDAGDAEKVGQLVKAIRSIVAAETSGPFEAFERKLEGLGAKIDAALSKSGGKRFDELNERIDRVHKSLAARIDRGAEAGQLEQLVTKLAKKIDAALDPKAVHPAFDELGRKIERLEERLNPASGAKTAAGAVGNEQFRDLAQRIDFVHSELAARIEAGAQARIEEASGHLAELVSQLSQKMDAALDPNADRAAFSSLEHQIERLSERLDRSDKSIASFASVERTIGELFDRIEDAHGSTTRAAELAARQAARDVLREATAPGALQSALDRELAELRNVQDESGQRTHETLSAVHETLERVVERLAVFEEELADLRQAPPAAADRRDEAQRRRGAQPKAAARAPELDDVLLEPGSRSEGKGGKPGRTSEAELAGERSVQADFIAAARRAAQQAAVDAQAAQARGAKKPRAVEREFDDLPQPAQKIGLGAAVQARKRPLLLGLGALVLLIGAYQIARVSVDAPAPIAPTVKTEPGNSIDSEAAPQSRPETTAGAPAAPSKTAPTATEPAGAPQASAPTASSAPPAVKLPSMIPAAPPATGFNPPPAGTLGKASESVDPTPVGAIGPASAGAAAAARADVVSTIRDAAAAGDGSAQFELGVRYVEGHGVPRDPKAAFQWFEKAAGQGLAPAQYRLGSLYEKGIGVDRDYVQARKWYQRAAEAGNARAMHNLAVLYAEGGDGKPDYVTAANWFRKAAEYGVRDSQFNLAILSARGLGVQQSLTQSYLWFSAAAAQGDDDAAKKRDEVGARLDSKELSAAKALADAFRPKQPEKASNEVAPPLGGWENVKVKAPAKPDGKPNKPKVSAL